MRDAFIQGITEAAEQDERIWLLTGDLGYSVVERFAERFPNRFVNVGVAEQNMMGIAAGLALAGHSVFAYSIANFSTFRCLEQIRNDVCHHCLPVCVVSVGGGLTYGSLGYSHHAIEDLAVMRCLPNMTVLAPGDPLEARGAVKTALALRSPCYLRLGKANEPSFFSVQPPVVAGEPNVVRAGKDLTLVSTGGALSLTMDAAAALAGLGFEAEVLTMPVVAPLSDDSVARLAGRTGRLVSVEEHVSGGLGGAIAESLCSSGATARFRSVTLRPTHMATTGSRTYLQEKMGLTVEAVLNASKLVLAA